MSENFHENQQIFREINVVTQILREINVVTQILREINFGECRSCKTTVYSNFMGSAFC